MLPYYLLFISCAVPCIIGYDGRGSSLNNDKRFYWRLMKWTLIAMIGFRFEVGGDWFTYLKHYDRALYTSFSEILGMGDPGYVFINVISAKLNLGITGVNLFCAVILVTGLFSFLNTLPRPWLGLTCAIPYLVIVVAMGYTRQSVALGLIMIAIVAIRQSQFYKFVAWVVLAAAFHKTAVLFLPLGAMISSNKRMQRLGMIALATIVSYELFLAKHSDRLYSTYIDNDAMDSEGALVRLLMNAIPGAIFVWLNKSYLVARTEKSFWLYVAWLSIIMIILLFTTGFTTALDRMALYLIPLQIWVFSHLPSAIRVDKNFITFAIISYYISVLTIWVLFATHAKYWLPYQIGIH